MIVWFLTSFYFVIPNPYPTQAECDKAAESFTSKPAGYTISAQPMTWCIPAPK